MSATARRKNRNRGEKKGHRRERGRTYPPQVRDRRDARVTEADTDE